MKVLVVAAHPDDEVLGCGGTLRRLANEGHEVFIAVMGEGIKSRFKDPSSVDPSALDALAEHGRTAAAVLGAREIVFYGLPDNRFDTVPLLEVVGLVEECAARIMPDQVYTHKGSDLNVDHRIVHQAVLTAFRPTPEQGVADIYSFEVPSSTEWAFSPSESFFRPQVYVDISAVLHVKLQALACYETEVRAFPHPRSPEALTAIARRWGSVAGCEAAEAFEAVRIVRKKGMEL